MENGMRHTHHRGGIRHHLHSGRGNVFYLYEEPECVIIDGVRVCPDTGSLDSAGKPKPNTLERRSPLPAGRYWVDVFGKNIPVAQSWFRAFKDLGVHVDATEHFESTEMSSIREWYLFSYTPVNGVPVVWDTTLGYPTIADSSVKSSGDTSSASLPLDALDELSNWMNGVEQKLGGSLGSLAKVAPYAILGGVALGGYLLLKEIGLLGKVKTSVRRLRKQ
jgi:hypothetical protein